MWCLLEKVSRFMQASCLIPIHLFVSWKSVPCISRKFENSLRFRAYSKLLGNRSLSRIRETNKSCSSWQRWWHIDHIPWTKRWGRQQSNHGQRLWELSYLRITIREEKKSRGFTPRKISRLYIGLQYSIALPGIMAGFDDWPFVA